MLIGIHALEFDPAASVVVDIHPSGVDFGESARRNRRIPTIDGNVAVVDFGSTDSDRTLRFTWSATKYEEEVLDRMMKLHPRWIVSTEKGVWESIPGTVVTSNGSTTVTVLPVRRMSE